VATLLGADCNLIAYHLPLDAHPTLGNNAVALERLGISAAGSFAEHRGAAIGLWGELETPITVDELAQRCRLAFEHEVVHCPGGGDAIRRIGVVTGGGHIFLNAAAELGLDALVTGELSEQSWHEAAELGCHCLACGHHATECRAVHGLGAKLAQDFDLEHVALAESNPL
jgi:putative NIF3 family GTP cyclohydrolase 1 type 2